MNDKEQDRLLRIQTTGTREPINNSVHYNRYEATPYEALETLFDEYAPDENDVMVDFGCGKGRFSFYVHNRFNIPVTGIEMSGQLHQEALENQASYMRKMNKFDSYVRFECCLAEEYTVGKLENKFYFFNPFSVQIFMKVIDNILLSVEKDYRLIDIILYYPTVDYIEFLDTNTSFELFEDIKVPRYFEHNENERFLIFRLEM
ncbi:methyltransferase [Sporosarcina sp. CAU 1771]